MKHYQAVLSKFSSIKSKIKVILNCFMLLGPFCRHFLYKTDPVSTSSFEMTNISISPNRLENIIQVICASKIKNPLTISFW